MKLSNILALLISSSLLALTACGTSTIGGGSGGGTGGTGNGTGNGGNGAGFCMGELSGVSCTETSCPSGYTCVPDADPTTCHSSGCSCDEEYGWLCTADCGQNGSSCVPDTQPSGNCGGLPDPRSCTATSCPAGFTCQVDADPTTCHPSHCDCALDGWVCTDDCGMGGSTCVPTDTTCNGEPSPASCTDGSCPDGFDCVPDADPNSCHPINCACTATGWACDLACQLNGSTCVQAP